MRIKNHRRQMKGDYSICFPLTKGGGFGPFAPREAEKVSEEHPAYRRPPPTRAATTQRAGFSFAFCIRVPELPAPHSVPHHAHPASRGVDFCAATCLLVSTSSSFSWLPISLPNCKILVQNVKPGRPGFSLHRTKVHLLSGLYEPKQTLLMLSEVGSPQGSCVIVELEYRLPNLQLP